MADSRKLGWQALLEGFPWFRGEGNYPLPAYSERMAAPRLGRSPYGGMLEDFSPVSDPYGWTITEAGRNWRSGRGSPIWPSASSTYS